MSNDSERLENLKKQSKQTPFHELKKNARLNVEIIKDQNEKSQSESNLNEAIYNEQVSINGDWEAFKRLTRLININSNVNLLFLNKKNQICHV
ncbi:MAG: hypothetical protein E6713_11845, partial [Sporomusaceae bacterium]|nr:hypothetical protein [Sporomusaceae bacterium]